MHKITITAVCACGCREHIPKARFFDLSTHTKPTPSVARPLPDIRHFCSQLETAGVSDNHHVIVYDKSSTMFAARLYMQCKVRALSLLSFDVVNVCVKETVRNACD